MDFKTIGGKSAIVLSACLFFLFNSCKKEIDQETVITIRCETPHNGQGIAGCKVIIYEIKSKKDVSVTGDVKGDITNTFMGITDGNGNATIRFHYMRKSKYQYKLAYDYSEIQQPEGMNELEIITPKGWATYLDKSRFEYTFKFNVLGKCGIHFKAENINCSNQNDSVQIEMHNINEYDFDPFSQYHSYYTKVGCGVVWEYTTSPTQINTGIRAVKYRVYRNSSVTEHLDTFSLMPGIVNDVVIQY